MVFLYKFLKKPVYMAETTFVIDSGSESSSGQFSSIASIVGVNLNALSDASSLFQTDNIIESARWAAA